MVRKNFVAKNKNARSKENKIMLAGRTKTNLIAIPYGINKSIKLFLEIKLFI